MRVGVPLWVSLAVCVADGVRAWLDDLVKVALGLRVCDWLREPLCVRVGDTEAVSVAVPLREPVEEGVSVTLEVGSALFDATCVRDCDLDLVCENDGVCDGVARWLLEGDDVPEQDGVTLGETDGVDDGEGETDPDSEAVAEAEGVAVIESVDDAVGVAVALRVEVKVGV